MNVSNKSHRLATRTLALMLALSTAAPAAMAQGQNSGGGGLKMSMANADAIPMRALPGIDFDAWLRVLNDPTMQEKKPLSADQLGHRLAQIIEKSISVYDLFASVLLLQSQHGLPDRASYRSMADALFAARHKVRINAGLEMNERYAYMTLLEFLGEEVLFAMNLRYPGQEKEYVISFDKLSDETKSRQKTANLRGIEVTTGDIVLSKFSGTGSSSFIALSTERPSLYSHSAAVYVQPDTGELLSPESFIEDGVKLRPMKDSYIDLSKTRMFVFRAKGATASDREQRLKNAADGVQSFVRDMYARVKDPRSQAAFGYNFSMNPKNSGESFNCTETVMNVYERGGLRGNDNPYGEQVWGRFSDDYASIIKGFLEMDAEIFPSPGDLDMNPNYKLAGLRLDIEKLAQDRMEMAAIDALFAMIARNHSQIRESLKVFDNLGEKKISVQEIAFIKSLEAIPKNIRDQIGAQIPANINIKQLIFFGYLNQKFTPAVRDAMTKDAEALWKAEKRAPGLNELRAMAAKHAASHIEAIKALADAFGKLAH